MSAGMSRAEACVACPFHRGGKKGDKKVLKCASPLMGGMETETRFRSEAARKKQEQLFCRTGRYPNCPLCAAIDSSMDFKRPAVDKEGKRR